MARSLAPVVENGFAALIDLDYLGRDGDAARCPSPTPTPPSETVSPWCAATRAQRRLALTVSFGGDELDPVAHGGSSGAPGSKSSRTSCPAARPLGAPRSWRLAYPERRVRLRGRNSASTPTHLVRHSEQSPRAASAGFVSSAGRESFRRSAARHPAGRGRHLDVIESEEGVRWSRAVARAALARNQTTCTRTEGRSLSVGVELFDEARRQGRREARAVRARRGERVLGLREQRLDLPRQLARALHARLAVGRVRRVFLRPPGRIVRHRFPPLFAGRVDAQRLVQE